MKSIWAVILAAGSGTRLSSALGGRRKQYVSFQGWPLYWKSAQTFASVPDVRGIVFVFPPQEVEEREAEVRRMVDRTGFPLPVRVAAGGERRQDSVYNGLKTLPQECEAVLVHDAARPFFSASMVTRIVDALRGGAAGVVPAISVTDTIKQVAGNAVRQTLVRSELRAVQTPQGFPLPLLRDAHEQANAGQWEVTDDASMVERLATVVVVAGELGNCKITTPEDLRMLQDEKRAEPVTGWGYDVHRYGGDRPLKLGGVSIPGDWQVQAHSDGDVLLHALADAILGTFGGGDIGLHFPDTDARFAGLESSILVREVLEAAAKAGVEIVNVDLTVIAQVPRLAPHRELIRKSVARLLGLAQTRVNFKATTEEKLGFTGQKKGIKGVACVSALRTFKAGE